MQKKASLLFGITLIALALFALAANLLVGLAGGKSFHAAFNSWPLIVIGAGLLFCIPPFLFRNQPGLGGMFIPGIPVLATGILLFAASTTGKWRLWAGWWPMEVIGLALGFVLAAISMRIVWLMIPASIIGMTGLTLQFCALTHAWNSWAVLWTIVPFSVGLPLLLIGLFRKSDGLRLAGIIICSLAGLAFAGMSALIPPASTIVRMIGPLVILVLGALLVVSALIRKPQKTDPPADKD